MSERYTFFKTQPGPVAKNATPRPPAANYTSLRPDIYIYIYIYTELAPKLTATASVAQSVERWSRDPGSRVQFPTGGLGVAFFATGPGWVLKNVYLSDTRIYLTLKHLFVDNECKCQM